MPTILWLVPMCEVLGLLGFISIASSTDEPSLRYSPLLAAAIVVIWLFSRKAKLMTLRQLSISAVFLSFVLVAMFQVFGLIFPGLSKGVDLISFANVIRLAAIFAIALAGHASALAVCYLLSRRQK